MTKNMKRMTALACAAMMIASMGITGCGKADGQTKEETKTTAVETPAGTETSATTENEAGKLPDGTGQEGGAADTESASESDPMMGRSFLWRMDSLRCIARIMDLMRML